MASTENLYGKRMLREREAYTYCGLCRSTFREWVKSTDARRNFGRAVRYDKRKLDEALDAMPTTCVKR